MRHIRNRRISEPVTQNFWSRTRHHYCGLRLSRRTERSTAIQPPKTKHSDFDIFWEIYTLRSCTPVTWIPHWVKGHQDDHAEMNDLDPFARLNVEMDSQAKNYWHHLQTTQPPPHSPYLALMESGVYGVTDNALQNGINRQPINYVLTLPQLYIGGRN